MKNLFRIGRSSKEETPKKERKYNNVDELRKEIEILFEEIKQLQKIRGNKDGEC